MERKDEMESSLRKDQRAIWVKSEEERTLCGVGDHRIIKVGKDL